MAKKAATKPELPAVQESPGTAIATTEPSRFEVLKPDSEIAQALAANLNGEKLTVSDLTIVKTPSGGNTNWTIEELSGEVTTDSITGLLVYYAPHGVLWPLADPSGDSKPLLVTDNLITARKVGDDYGDLDPKVIEAYRNDDGTYDWLNLPYNQFGTGKGGFGKRCKEQRIMCILREQDHFPLLIRVAPGSLRNVTPFVKKLPVEHWRAIVELKLEKAKSSSNQDFSKIKPRLAGTISREHGAIINATYTKAIGAAAQEGALSGADDSGGDDLE